MDNRTSDCHRDGDVGQLRSRSNPDRAFRRATRRKRPPSPTGVRTQGGWGGAVGGGGARGRVVRLRFNPTNAKVAPATITTMIAPMRAYPTFAGKPGTGVPPGPPGAARGFLVIEIVPEPRFITYTLEGDAMTPSGKNPTVIAPSTVSEVPFITVTFPLPELVR